jgi:hypothetical protein
LYPSTIFVRKVEGKRVLGCSRRIGDENTELNLKETGCGAGRGC